MADPPPPLAAGPPPEGDADAIELGSGRVSKTQFALFAGEAHLHLGTLKDEHETLKAHGIITDAMLQAVQSLAGIAGTVQLTALQQLASACERTLQVLAIAPLSEQEEALVGDAVEALDQRVQQALDLHDPAPAGELLDRLEHARQAGAPDTDA